MPAKTIKSKIYESRLAEFGQLFEDNKEELQRALTAHTALGVDSANRKLDGQTEQLQRIEQKIDMMMVFRKLDTSREKEVQQFIDDHGGAKNVIDNERLLNDLVKKSGESVIDQGSGRRGDGGIKETQQMLQKELKEDVDELLKKNISLFERKLDMQEKRLASHIHESEGNILSAIFSGSHERIMDTVRLILLSLQMVSKLPVGRIYNKSGKKWFAPTPAFRTFQSLTKHQLSGLERQRQG